MSMESKVTERVRNMPPSGIRKFFDIVQEMEDAISLGVGEPDFVTPWGMREAAIYALEQGKTQYTSNWGDFRLREAIARYMRTRFSLNYDPHQQILVTVGGSEGIDLAMRAFISPGDEVLIPDPSYVSYAPGVTLAMGTPIAVRTYAEHGFSLQPEDLEAAITERSRILVLPYPNNPTGGIMRREDLERIAPVIMRHDLLVISDEIYAELYYGEGRHVSIAELPGMQERTILLSGMSKCMAMTGWRVGYACGPKELIAAMLKIHQYVIMCAPIMGQMAALEGLVSEMDNGFREISRMRRAYNRRRRIMHHGFNSMGLPCFEPLGAFYCFPCIQSTGMSSEEFCQHLLREEKVAVVPGTAFGESGEGYVRASYAASQEKITEALQRIARFVEKHIQ